MGQVALHRIALPFGSLLLFRASMSNSSHLINRSTDPIATDPIFATMSASNIRTNHCRRGYPGRKAAIACQPVVLMIHPGLRVWTLIPLYISVSAIRGCAACIGPNVHAPLKPPLLEQRASSIPILVGQVLNPSVPLSCIYFGE